MSQKVKKNTPQKSSNCCRQIKGHLHVAYFNSPDPKTVFLMPQNWNCKFSHSRGYQLTNWLLALWKKCKAEAASTDSTQTPTFPTRAVLEIFPHLHSRQHLLGRRSPAALRTGFPTHGWSPLAVPSIRPIVCENSPSIMDICHPTTEMHRWLSWWNNQQGQKMSAYLSVSLFWIRLFELIMQSDYF